MDARERAERVCHGFRSGTERGEDHLVDAVTEEIRAAGAAERERCAKVARKVCEAAREDACRKLKQASARGKPEVADTELAMSNMAAALAAMVEDAIRAGEGGAS